MALFDDPTFQNESHAGIDFDSMGRPWADVPSEHTGQMQRQVLDEDGVLAKMSAETNAGNEDLIAQAEEADAMLAAQIEGNELPGLLDPSMNTIPSELNANRYAGAIDDYATARADLLAKEKVTTRDPQHRIAKENVTLMKGDPRPYEAIPWDESQIDQTQIMPFDPEFDVEARLAEFIEPERREGESVEAWQLRTQRAYDNHRLRIEGLDRANKVALQHNTQVVESSKADWTAQQEAERLRLMEDPEIEEIGTPGAPGMLEYEMGASKDIADGKVAQAEVAAEALRYAADISKAGAEEIAESIAIGQEHEQNAREASVRYREHRDEMQRRYEAMPPADRQRFMKNMSGGQKFWAVLGMIGGGLAKSDASVRMLYKLAEDDYQSQLNDLDQARSQIDEYDAGINSARALFREGRQAINNDIAHKHEWIAFQLEDAARELEAQMAETTVPQIVAEQKLALAQIRRLQQAERHQAELYLEAHPTPTVTRTRNKVRGAERKLLEDELDAARKEVYASRDKAVDLGTDAVNRELDAQKAGAQEARAARAEKRMARTGEGGVTRRAEAVNKDIYKFAANVDALDKFLKKYEASNIAGRGASAYFATEEGRRVRSEITDIIVDDLFANSGANVPKDEFARAKKQQMQGWGDEEFRRNAEQLLERTARKVKARMGSADADVRTELMNNWAREGFDTTRYGATGESSRDIAKRLGGKVLTGPR